MYAASVVNDAVSPDRGVSKLKTMARAEGYPNGINGQNPC